MLRRRFLSVLGAGALGALAGCTSDDDARPRAAGSASPAPTVQDNLPPVTDELSLPALMREDWRAGRIRVVEELGGNSVYSRSRITYGSGDLTISGVLLRPRDEGTYPGIVLNHGYIDPEVYKTGQGLRREQEKLARAGFVVLHTDYRGHADSDPPRGPFDAETRLGYTEDAICAVLALQQEPYVDANKMAMLGRSMGGAVTLNALVVRPDLVQAAVIFSSVSSLFVENVEHFTASSRPKAASDFYDAFGLPDLSPEFYAGLSARTYFDRITAPILLHHGTEDGTCPYRWSVETQRALAKAGVDSELRSWPGEDHAFYAAWDSSMDASIEFLEKRLDL